MKGLLEKFFKAGLLDIDGGTGDGGGAGAGAGGTQDGKQAGAGSGSEPPAWQVNLDPDYADILKPQADKFKQMGLSADIAQKFIDGATAEFKQNTAAIAKERQDLETKWGGKEQTEKNIQTALKTMEQLGFNEDDAAALTRLVGASKVYERFFEISKKLGADIFTDRNGSTVVYQPNNLDAAQAQAEVNRLQKDSAFMAKINENDPDAVAKLDSLIDIANGVK